MNLPDRHLLMGMTLGAICATALAAIGPGYVVEAFADEAPVGIDASKLVKFGDREYQVDYEPWVATDPLSSTTVKKIEGGRVSYVSISTTATGTYSTDGLTSPHVQYPGIAVTEVTKPRFSFSSWSNGRWLRLSTHQGKSFVSLVNGWADSCVSGKGFRVCN
ncbi:hypothetical protein IC608_08185 [Devosia sp. PTR5]|uniref:Uncharacterized protein n=1 Tax=Devosia oryzisoli TaxID=2774138 RepID=A0A927FSI4_9HYPH|nr:hypothetical protein [Devosia oryzisoli]MBD8065450.1 hypothetical protein [Devosia oryzisoli]